MEDQDLKFMKMAFDEAKAAASEGEIPVGAVVVCKGMVIARAHNLTETLTDVTAHAEMQAITAAASYLGGKYLDECTLYVTLEPCTMCAGAIGWSQLKRLVYGASDPKRGYSTPGKRRKSVPAIRFPEKRTGSCAGCPPVAAIHFAACRPAPR